MPKRNKAKDTVETPSDILTDIRYNTEQTNKRLDDIDIKLGVSLKHYQMRL